MKARVSPFRCRLDKTRPSSPRLSHTRSHSRRLPPSTQRARFICSKPHRFPVITLEEPGNRCKPQPQFQFDTKFRFLTKLVKKTLGFLSFKNAPLLAAASAQAAPCFCRQQPLSHNYPKYAPAPFSLHCVVSPFLC